MNAYDEDLKNFYSKIVGEANVKETTYEKDAPEGQFVYMKEKVWVAPRQGKEDAYGVWIENVTLWDEEVYETVSKRRLGAGVIEEIKMVKSIIHHTDIEYYSYGNVRNTQKSKYVHQSWEVAV